MKKGKLFTPFLTLFMAAITLGIMLYLRYKLSKIVWILLLVIVIFYIMGSIIQNKVFSFMEENEEKAREEEEKEGAVIEKEAQEQMDEDEEEQYSLPPLTGEIPEVPGQPNNTTNEFRTRME